MILFSAVDEVIARYPEQIAELQRTLASHGLQTGSVEAVSLLAEQVEKGGAVRDDLFSMLRVICAQEPDTSYLEMLGMLLVASGGAAQAREMEAAPALEGVAHQLFDFVLGVKRPATRDVEPAEADSDAIAPGVDDPAAYAEYPEPPEQAASALTADNTSPDGTESSSRPHALARALALAAEEEDFPAPAPAAVPRVTTTSREPLEDEAEPLLFVHASEPPANGRGWRRSLGLGLGGLALGVVIGMFLPRRVTPEPEATPASATAADSAATPGSGASGSSAGAADAAHRRAGAPRDRAGRPANEGRSLSSSGMSPYASETADIAASVAAGRAAGEAPPSVPEMPASTGSAAPLRPAAVRPVHLKSSGDMGAPSAKVRVPRVLTGSSGIMAANLMSSPAPGYPAQASAAQVQGQVVIEAIVGKNGEVIETRVVSGPPLLREAALQAVQRWRYRPYEVDGSAAEIATTALIDFRLE